MSLLNIEDTQLTLPASSGCFDLTCVKMAYFSLPCVHCYDFKFELIHVRTSEATINRIPSSLQAGKEQQVAEQQEMCAH